MKTEIPNAKDVDWWGQLHRIDRCLVAGGGRMTRRELMRTGVQNLRAETIRLLAIDLELAGAWRIDIIPIPGGGSPTTYYQSLLPLD